MHCIGGTYRVKSGSVLQPLHVDIDDDAVADVVGGGGTKRQMMLKDVKSLMK